MKALLIVESPRKVKNITHYLETGGFPDIKVAASRGHIRDLPVHDLGVDTSTFAASYFVSQDKDQIVSKLKDLLKNVDTVYLATDPDREGEAIAWHLYEALNLVKMKQSVFRIKFNEISKSAIIKAMSEPGSIDMHLVAAQEARRVLDRLIGYMVSPRLGNRLSAGRVQSPALRLVVDREAEILNFVPVTHYDVKAVMEQPVAWHALWDHGIYRAKGQAHWLDIDTATAIKSVKQLTVLGIEDRQRRVKPPAPFTTSALQQASSTQLKMSPQETMDLADKLFAAGFITYQRTDSPNLSEESIDMVRKELQTNGLAIASTMNRFPVKESAQEAHEAIRPVDFSIKIAGETALEQALYQLIRLRALASQMPDAVFDVVETTLQGDVLVPIDQKPALFKAKGEILTDQGWMALTAPVTESEEQQDDDQQSLPSLTKGQIFSAEGILLTKQTTPPLRYSEASLIKKLESLGIGRPSTYAAILENIKRRDYVIINRTRKLEPTEKGNKLIQVLTGAHFSFMQYDWTEGVEAQLDEISMGKSRYFTVVSQFYSKLMSEIQGLPIPEEFRKVLVEGTQCRCGGAIEEGAKTYECNACKSTVWKVIASRTIKPKEAFALLAGETLLLTGFFKKNSKELFDAQIQVNAEGKVTFVFEDTPFQEANRMSIEGAQCRCGGQIDEGSKTYECTTCKALIWKTLSERAISQAEAIALFSGETLYLTGFVGKTSKKCFDTNVRLNDLGKVEFVFEERPVDMSGEVVGECRCKGSIRAGKNNWQCSNCKATVWHEMSGKKITQQDALTLFKGESIAMTGLTSKAGNSFNAIVYMNDGKPKFKFD